MRMSDLYNSENYNVFMYVAISVTILLLFFNSLSIVETGLQEFDGSRLTGYVIEEEISEFDNYYEKVLENTKVKRSRGLTGFAVEDNEVDEEKKAGTASSDSVNLEENIPEGELYTEGSFFIYYMLLGFVGLCIFILSAIFFLPRLKELT